MKEAESQNHSKRVGMSSWGGRASKNSKRARAERGTCERAPIRTRGGLLIVKSDCLSGTGLTVGVTRRKSQEFVDKAGPESANVWWTNFLLGWGRFPLFLSLI